MSRRNGPPDVSMDRWSDIPFYRDAMAHLKEWVEPNYDFMVISYSKEGISPRNSINMFEIQIFNAY